MKILPIQNFTIYTNKKNSQQKINYQSPLLVQNQAKNVDFRGLMGLFKKNENKLISYTKAIDLIKNISDKSEGALQIALHFAEKGDEYREYYKSIIEEIVKLTNEGFSIKNLFYTGMKKKTPKEFKEYANQFRKFNQMGYPQNYIKYLIGADEEDVKNLLDIRKVGYEKRDILAPSEEIEDGDLDELFLAYPARTLDTITILGRESFIHSFKEGYDNVLNNILNIGEISTEHELFQNLLELTNPTASDKYIETQAKIKELKKQFQQTKDKEGLIKEINRLTDSNKNLVAKSIKDPFDKIKVGHIFNMLSDTPSKLKIVLKNCNLQTKDSKCRIDKILSKIATLDLNDKYCDKLNFRNNKYLMNLFTADDDFREMYKVLLTELNKYPKKDSIENIFSGTSFNKDTKAQFKKLGINFDKWVKCNPNLKIQKEIMLDNSNRQSNVIKNLEETLCEFRNYTQPQKNLDAFFDTIAKKGFTLEEISVPHYDITGFFEGGEEDKVFKLYKDKKAVKFEDLPLLFKTIKEFMNTDSYWQTQKGNNIIKNHLKLRFNEMRSAKEKVGDKPMMMTVQKVDMNNLEHSLFLGNHASCCTAVGSGGNQWSAVNYVICKMFSAIEVLDGKEAVGNTMCYIAEIDGKPSLVLDNIELKAKYQYNDEIRDSIVEYAKKMTAEIGKPDMPIYAGPNRHKVNMDVFEFQPEKDFRVIGSTGEEGEVYLDFDADAHVINGDEVFNSGLYKIR